MRGLTFDMRGGRKQAKLACGRPLDGRVRFARVTHGCGLALDVACTCHGDLFADCDKEAGKEQRLCDDKK